MRPIMPALSIRGEFMNRNSSFTRAEFTIALRRLTFSVLNMLTLKSVCLLKPSSHSSSMLPTRYSILSFSIRINSVIITKT